MSALNKTKEELVKELQKLRKELNALKASYENDIIEHNRATDVSSKYEMQYSTLFNSIAEGFCIIEVIFDKNEKPIDYRFLEINPSFEKQTGLIDAKGKRMRELAPKHEEYWFEIYGNIALTGESTHFTNCAEQLHRWYDVYAFRVNQPEKRQVVVLFNDITERKKVEKDLRESRQTFSDIITNLDEAYFSCTLDGLLLEHNVAFKRIFGFDPDQSMKGVKMPDFWQNPKERSKYLDILMNEGFIRNYLVETKTINGEKTVVMVNSHLVKDENGKVVRIEGTLADLTERVRMEETLRRSEEKYSKAFQTSPYAIALTNAKDGKFIEINNAFTSITGFTREDITADSSIGLNLWVDIEDRKRVVSALTEGSEVKGREFQFRKKMAKSFWVCSLPKSFISMTNQLFYQAPKTSLSASGQKRNL